MKRDEVYYIMEMSIGDSIFTPFRVVEAMLDFLPKQVWRDPYRTWFEPDCGVGNFIVPVFFRLMDGLVDVIPNEKERKQHIVTKMLFMSEVNHKFIQVCKKIFGSMCNIYSGEALKLDLQSFDIILGNPPYQEQSSGRGSTKPLYNIYIERLIDKCNTLLFICPSRWFGAGKGLATFRKNMLLRKDIKRIQHYENSTTLFPGSSKIMGGISILYKDSNYYGYCNFNASLCNLNKYDIIVEPRYQSIVDKILIKMDKSLLEVCIGQNYTGIRSNDNRLQKYGDHKCFISDFMKNTKTHMYVSKDHVIDRNYDKWKVFTVEANGYWKCFGKTFIGCPSQVCNQSYIVFEVDTLDEAASLASLLDCKLINFMMGIRKFSQHISPDTCKWIPLLPFDQVYHDELLYDLFNLDYFERKLIDDMYSGIILKKITKDMHFLKRIIRELTT